MKWMKIYNREVSSFRSTAIVIVDQMEKMASFILIFRFFFQIRSDNHLVIPNSGVIWASFVFIAVAAKHIYIHMVLDEDDLNDLFRVRRYQSLYSDIEVHGVRFYVQ
jgi:hypothetical protein